MMRKYHDISNVCVSWISDFWTVWFIFWMLLCVLVSLTESRVVTFPGSASSTRSFPLSTSCAPSLSGSLSGPCTIASCKGSTATGNGSDQWTHLPKNHQPRLNVLYTRPCHKPSVHIEQWFWFCFVVEVPPNRNLCLISSKCSCPSC